MKELAASLTPGRLVAISVTNLKGVYLSERSRDTWRFILEHAEHVGHVGYSIQIYRITNTDK